MKGSISNSLGQRKAAEAADQAAQLVLRGDATVTAIACEQLRREMRRVLGQSILGVRVTKFQTPGITPRSFPDD
jgi:hypothetical protein